MKYTLYYTAELDDGDHYREEYRDVTDDDIHGITKQCHANATAKAYIVGYTIKVEIIR